MTARINHNAQIKAAEGVTQAVADWAACLAQSGIAINPSAAADAIYKALEFSPHPEAARLRAMFREIYFNS
jgi:uncharacterized protein with von Willebrand factor type A (vWA) domain